MEEFFYFLEQTAPSLAAHARTCCAIFCRCGAGKWRLKFPNCLMLLAHINTFMSVGILLQYFCQELQV